MRGQDCLHVKKKSIFFLKKIHNSKLPKRNIILAICRHFGNGRKWKKVIIIIIIFDII